MEVLKIYLIYYKIIWQSYPYNAGFWLLTLPIFLFGAAPFYIRFLWWFLLFGIIYPLAFPLASKLRNKVVEEGRNKK